MKALYFLCAIAGLLCFYCVIVRTAQIPCVVTPDPDTYTGLTAILVSVAVKALADTLVADVNNINANLDDFIAEIRYYMANFTFPTDPNKYFFFSPDNPNNSYTLTADKTSFNNVPYDKSKPLIFVVHGYQLSIDLTSGQYYDLKNALLNLNKYNVVFVDYTSQTKYVLFSQLTKYVYVASIYMAKFLQTLMDATGTTGEQMHILGISLGGAVSSQFSKYIPNIARHTGLDHGGGFFAYFPLDLILDRNDAKFVNMIHANDVLPFIRGFGMYRPTGHLDIYPNGGQFQPGCYSTEPINQDPSTGLECLARSCMHNRMKSYYMESICNKNCNFTGHLCDSFDKFEQGQCQNTQTALLGEFATDPSVPVGSQFFLETNSQIPFCKS